MQVFKLETKYEKDDKLHPSEKGTRTLLEDIQKTCRKKIIRNSEICTNKYSYSGVDKSYRWGCTTCLNQSKPIDSFWCITCNQLANKCADNLRQSQIGNKSDYPQASNDEMVTNKTHVTKRTQPWEEVHEKSSKVGKQNPSPYTSDLENDEQSD